jgi:hypothetical protein
MIRFSIIVGLAGILGSVSVVMLLRRREPSPPAHAYWALGLGGLFPAWLTGFIALVHSATGPDAPLPPTAIASSALALFGVITTEFLVRWLSGRRGFHGPWLSWLLGASALAPAWLIALLFVP